MTELTESVLKSSGKRRGTMRLPTNASLGASEMKAECIMCLVEWEEGMKVEVFSCHPTHMLHAECYEYFVNFNKEKGEKLYCPICRAEIDESKTKRTILRAKGNNDGEDDEDDVKNQVVKVFSLDASAPEEDQEEERKENLN